jgi:aminoglycoside phosphotransferase
LSYYIFYKGDKPLIAIPKGMTYKQIITAVNSLSSFTFKRKIFKKYLIIKILINDFFGVKKGRHNDLDFLLKWANTYQSSNSYHNVHPIFIWSLVPNRKRYYVHFINANAERTLFAKITLNGADFLKLEKEYFNLKKNPNSNFLKPKIVDYGQEDEYTFLVVESLGEKYSLYHPSENKFPLELMSSLQGTIREVLLVNLLHVEWWQRFYESRDKFKELYEYITTKSKQEYVRISTIHGDFGSENILIDSDNKFMLIDWEQSVENGPYYTDIISFWMGKNHTELKNNRVSTIEEFYKEFSHISKLDLALALSFLVGANFDLAKNIAYKFED